jgi:RNA polymerase sigma-70 factor (ECF subfamily)
MAMSPVDSIDPSLDDEELMRHVAAGRAEAIGPLHGRYAPRIFSLSVQTLDRAAAEEIVQEVFVAVWRKAGTFDPSRGTFRAWVMRIAHVQVLNELRRRKRRPKVEPDPNGLHLAALSDPDPGPDLAEADWREFRRSTVRDAVGRLPDPQRQALSLAFFEELSHEQIATMLRLPLGTAKGRIRAALRTLRAHLGPILATFLALVGVLGLLDRHHRQSALDRQGRALRLVTSSDVVPLRLAPSPGMPAEAHGNYRGRPGFETAVLTLSYLPAPPTGRTYQAWALHRGRWTSLGTARPGPDGSALLIVEDPALATPSEAVQVTLEPTGGSASPTGPVAIAWPDRR